jgi:gamma-glutamylcysteine synthetase
MGTGNNFAKLDVANLCRSLGTGFRCRSDSGYRAFDYNRDKSATQAFLDMNQFYIGSLDHCVKTYDGSYHRLYLEQRDCFHDLNTF